MQPDLGTITSASFDRAEESIAIGAAAARAAIPQLQRFSVSEAEYQRFLAKQRRVAAAMPELTRVVTRDSAGQEDARVAARTTHKPGQVLDGERLRADLESRVRAAGLQSREVTRFRTFYSRKAWARFAREDATADDWKAALRSRSLDALKTELILVEVTHPPKP